MPAAGLVPDPVLADRLSGEAGADESFTKTRFPELRHIICWLSASCGMYLSSLQKDLPGVGFLPYGNMATEGVSAIACPHAGDPLPAGSILAIDQGIFEFVPSDNPFCTEAVLPPDVKTLAFHELEAGRTYRLVTSQVNGLYRYDTGDMYEITGFAGRVPYLRFSGRAGIVGSFSGEKLTEIQGTEDKTPLSTSQPYERKYQRQTVSKRSVSADIR